MGSDSSSDSNERKSFAERLDEIRDEINLARDTSFTSSGGTYGTYVEFGNGSTINPGNTYTPGPLSGASLPKFNYNPRSNTQKWNTSMLPGNKSIRSETAPPVSTVVKTVEAVLQRTGFDNVRTESLTASREASMTIAVPSVTPISERIEVDMEVSMNPGEKMDPHMVSSDELTSMVEKALNRLPHTRGVSTMGVSFEVDQGQDTIITLDLGLFVSTARDGQ